MPLDPANISTDHRERLPWLRLLWFLALILLLIGIVRFCVAVAQNSHDGQIIGLALLVPFALYAFVLSLISMVQLFKRELDIHVLGRDPFRESECQLRKANPNFAILQFTAEFKEMYQKEGSACFELAYERRIRQFHRHGIRPRIDRAGDDRTLFVPDVILYSKDSTSEAISQALAELCGIMAGIGCMQLVVIVPEVKETEENGLKSVTNLLGRIKTYVESIFSDIVQASSGPATTLIVEVPKWLVPKVLELGFTPVTSDDGPNARERLVASA